MEQAKIEQIERLERPKSFKARAYFLTTWKNDSIPIEKGNLVYGCKCEDISPKTGRYHNHLFLYFKNPIAFKTIQKIYGEEIHSKTIYSNSGAINYILDVNHKKASTKFNRQEFGQRPMDNGVNRCKTKDAINYTNEQIMDLAPREALMVLNIKQRLACTDLNTKTTYKDMNVIYICGPSDVGKTCKALDIIDEIEPTGSYANVKFDGNFWHGVKNSKSDTCLYDEWRDSKMQPDEFINFIDYNKHNLNVKNGEKINEFKNIIITSTKHPYFIYKHSKEEPRQWFKRFKLLDLYDPNNSAHCADFVKNNGVEIDELLNITEDEKKKLKWTTFN